MLFNLQCTIIWDFKESFMCVNLKLKTICNTLQCEIIKNMKLFTIPNVFQL